VRPETRNYLDKARQSLNRSRAILAIGLGEEAGRAAYLAAFHAAQALIFEQTGRVAKTHRGVHGQFLRLTTGIAGVDTELRRFMSEGYKIKATADYEVGPEAVVPLPEAAAAIEIAARFIEAVSELLGRCPR
jgi:uncharacterized protein (UPF0332 family)